MHASSNRIGLFYSVVFRHTKLLSLCVLWVGSQIISTHAEGFRNPPAGAFGLGRAGGRIAQIEDASAVAHNPANLVNLPGPEAQLAPGFVHLTADYQSPLGAKVQTRDPWKFLPAAFASVPLVEKRLALGVGVTAPYGISILYPRDSGFRYLAPYHNELKVVNFNPCLSLRVNDQLTVGAGVDVFYSQLKLRQVYPWFLWPGGAADGEMKAGGDGWAVGANFGLTWQPAQRHRLAATVRTPFDVDYDGHFQVSNIPAAGLAAGVSPSSPLNTGIGFPTVVAVGYGIELTDTIRLEADFEWLQFSRFKSLDLSMGNNAILFNALGQSTSINEGWRNTWTLGVAGDWEFSPGWKFLLGYQHYQSPIPGSTLSPSIPDASQNVLTTGISWQTKRHALAVSYGAVFYDHRDITNNQNPAFNGQWDMFVHIISVGYTFRF